MRIELRAATQDDRTYVEQVYFTTQRWLIEELFGWRGDAVEKAKFADFYDAQNSQIILKDGQSIGWWTVYRDDDTIELGQIYLVPQHQGRGVGAFLVRQLIAQPRSKRKR
jgi:GNAT superfamily N-acetyltransferase